MSKKVILTAGGKGTRVHELTGSVIPKSLSRISKRAPKPLVSYQLELLQKAGFTDIFIDFETDWQMQLFRQSISVSEVPNLNYHIGMARWGHPLFSFESNRLPDFVGDNDFLWTFGDLFYSPELLDGLVNLAIQNNTSVASMMYSRSSRWRDGGKRITFSKDEIGKITGVDLTKTGGFTLHSPMYFQNRAIETIREELKEGEGRTIPLLKRLVKKGQLSAYEPELLVNMNEPEDIKIVEKSILSYLNNE